MDAVADFLTEWYEFFDEWSLLESILTLRFTWLPEGARDAAPHVIATLLLASVPCLLLTILVKRRTLADNGLWYIPIVSGVLIGLSAVFLTLGSNDFFGELATAWGVIAEPFVALGEGFSLGGLINLVITVPIGIVCLAFFLVLSILPFVPMIVAIVLDATVYGPWMPVALVGDLGVGVLCIAAVMAGFFAFCIYLVVFVPLLAGFFFITR